MSSKIMVSFVMTFLIGMVVFAFCLSAVLKPPAALGWQIVSSTLAANLVAMFAGMVVVFFMTRKIEKFVGDFENDREINNEFVKYVQNRSSYLAYWIGVLIIFLFVMSASLVAYYIFWNNSLALWEVLTLPISGAIAGLISFIFALSNLEKDLYEIREMADQKNTLPTPVHPGPNMFFRIFLEFLAFSLALILLVGLYVHNMIMYQFKDALNPLFFSNLLMVFRGDLIGLLGIGVLLAYLIAQSYSEISIKPLQKLDEYLKSISTGDLSKRLLSGASDELYTVCRSVSYIVNSLKLLVLRAKDMGFDINATVQSIRTSEEQQAHGAIETAKTLGSAISVLHEITRTAGSVHKNAESVSQAARATLSAAKYGQQAVEIIDKEMDRIKAKVSEIAKGITVLEDRSHQISSIANVIDEITEQTNLLAVNASIEAARAGEAGRGFAVVASEIRKLAERAADSTREIKNLIVEIKSDTFSAVSATRESAGSVERGIESIKETTKAIEKINQMILHTGNAAQEIVSVSMQQKSSTEEIVGSIQALSGVSQKFESSARELVESTRMLNQLATGLGDLISGYKVEEA